VTALRPDGNDHRVLHLLCLDETQHFGAEVLRAIGPADAAACDLAEAQMHALKPRRIDGYLIKRLRQRQAVELSARKLDRDERARLPGGIDLIEIGADRSLHRIDEMAQNAVLIEDLHLLERAFDSPRDVALVRAALLRRDRGARIKARME